MIKKYCEYILENINFSDAKYKKGDIVYYEYDPLSMSTDRSGYYEIFGVHRTPENYPYIWSYDLSSTIKPSERIYSKEDPYGEEDWGTPDESKEIVLHADEENMFKTKEECEENKKESWRHPRWDVYKKYGLSRNKLKYKFKPGDSVVINDKAAIPYEIQIDRNEYETVNKKEFVGKKGVVIDYWGSFNPMYLVRFDHKFSKKQNAGWGGGEDPTKQSEYFDEECLDFLNA